ncbi:MAG: hydrolase [Oscillospiraceae bacterium]|nr:hydrolase [Oscillospiraceae bacterium]
MDYTEKKHVPSYEGVLRSHMIQVPSCIAECSGIRIFGRRIKSLVFSTDAAIIKNINADAVIAVYPFTPQPAITRAVLEAADMPVLVGIGGGTTKGPRVLRLGCAAEDQGAIGVVVNAPIPGEVIRELRNNLEIPIVATVVSDRMDIAERIEAGASILNVSAAADTARIVAAIRAKFPHLPIIATGGPTEESIMRTIDAGANAITYTPPTTAELFGRLMTKYREMMVEDSAE